MDPSNAWLSSFPGCGPAYSAAYDSPPDMLYDMMPEPTSMQMSLPQSPMLSPMPSFQQQYPNSSMQPAGFNENNNNNSSSNNSSSFKAFRNNFMFFEPQPQPPQMPMNLMPMPSMPMFNGRGDSSYNWCNSGIDRLIMDDEMYFGRSDEDDRELPCVGGGNSAARVGGGGGCDAGWLPDDSQQQQQGWAIFDPNTTLRPPGVPCPPQDQAAMWQMGGSGYRQLLPDI